MPRFKPWCKNIDAISCMDQPNNLKQILGFLGAVNFYRDMWPKQAPILTPLSAESVKRTFHWTDEMDKSSKQMNAILIADALMA